MDFYSSVMTAAAGISGYAALHFWEQVNRHRKAISFMELVLASADRTNAALRVELKVLKAEAERAAIQRRRIARLGGKARQAKRAATELI